MKLVYFLQWEGEALAALEPEFSDVTFIRATSPEDTVREVADADALVIAGPYYTGEIAAAVNARARRLRWLHTSSIGTDKFEAGGVPDGIVFTNSAGLKGRTVAEHAMALMLGHIHALPQMERLRAANQWGRDELRSRISCLEGQTLLLLGYGSIGREIARKAKAFDMHVVALNNSGDGGAPADIVAPVSDLAEWLPAADFVVSSLPLTADTEHLISGRQFRAMKPASILINVGRGPVVDHAALLQALREKRIAGACLDVFEQEPLPRDDAFWTMPNVILSPHVAGTGGPLGQRFAELVSDNIARFREGRPLTNTVKISRD